MHHAPAMAIKLEKALGVSAESWFTMQSAYELWHADQDKAPLSGVFIAESG